MHYDADVCNLKGIEINLVNKIICLERNLHVHNCKYESKHQIMLQTISSVPIRWISSGSICSE